jgi:hypothetical protein
MRLGEAQVEARDGFLKKNIYLIKFSTMNMNESMQSFPPNNVHLEDTSTSYMGQRHEKLVVENI